MAAVMETEYNKKCSNEHAASLQTTSKLPRHYSTSELKTIGEICHGHLPPASAVQAMFLYELRREAEIESLFQGSIFRLAKAEETSNGLAKHVEELQSQMRALQKQVAAKDVEERLATSKVRMDTQQTKLNDCSVKIEDQVERHDRLAARVQELEVAKAAAPPPTPPPPAKEVNGGSEEAITTLEAEVNVLFDERDALVTLLGQANDRIGKLEDLVRALTMQKTASPASTSSTLSQTLPLQTSTGNSVAISIPKGSGLTGGKENRPLTGTVQKSAAETSRKESLIAIIFRVKMQLEELKVAKEALELAQLPLREYIAEVNAKISKARYEAAQPYIERLNKYHDQAKEQNRKQNAKIKALREEKDKVLEELQTLKMESARAQSDWPDLSISDDWGTTNDVYSEAWNPEPMPWGSKTVSWDNWE